ncbi:hypothetical protein GE21DRAFT_9365 [Neurospora crassa]|uniref:Uncharacterized protein n=1 Tax=Neurospora crassa (strain ATCC 24698 / 74-OR23-1A / CBS 708.71 / DSM 1257 / FGSC 987) TaxID=367110 RepID=Q7S220_NEUCR|nr:hypothetical protein NCU05976 [Neurospora crassa OR74A]EAA29393.1 hypothetical protein NCU05976 [Neurospora crassa OR74A]KHE87483.1 hypothetical protein GE21DRAFT_9365 [Neurospora crassa]|eukprot:XP_958629.1 hypothetical protein NCU05976 [Neurospora crassa OR74A]
MFNPQVFDLQLKTMAACQAINLAMQSVSMWEHADKQTKHQQASSSRSLVNAAISSPVGLFNAGCDTRILSGQKKTCQKGHLPLQCLPRQPLTTRVRPPKRP